MHGTGAKLLEQTCRNHSLRPAQYVHLDHGDTLRALYKPLSKEGVEGLTYDFEDEVSGGKELPEDVNLETCP